MAAAAIVGACGTSSGDPCAGLGCATGPGTLVVRVIDAAGGADIVAPTFTENGQPLSPYCETDAGQIVLDAGASCGAWHFDTLSIGAHTVVVSAPGYGSQTLDVSIQGPAGCCGRGPEVDQTATLSALGGDAGDGGPVICNGVTCQPGFKCCASADGGVCAPASQC